MACQHRVTDVLQENGTLDVFADDFAGLADEDSGLGNKSERGFKVCRHLPPSRVVVDQREKPLNPLLKFLGDRHSEGGGGRGGEMRGPVTHGHVLPACSLRARAGRTI